MDENKNNSQAANTNKHGHAQTKNTTKKKSNTHYNAQTKKNKETLTPLRIRGAQMMTQ